MTLPWLDQPVWLHSSRADKCKLTPSQCEYRSGYWRYWYQADHVYGHATTYFMCAVIGVFAIGNLISRLSRRGKASKGSNGLPRVAATCRYLAYKSFRLGSLKWYSPSVGVMLLGIIGTIYFFALSLGPKPYYWPNTRTLSYGNSPPIGTRTGWMSLALLPFLMIASSKANFITYLTGISHEKLQVFHRWISWAMFVLALIHTFPFIVFHIWKGDMMMKWGHSVVYWSGVAALIPQAYLNIMSIGVIRNRYYEFFKLIHYIAIILFLFFFFIHCDFRLSSWDYFIATLSLYLSALFYSWFKAAKNSRNAKATSTLLPDSTVQITIPTSMSWKPGQHVFLRFWALGVHALTTHPFTICSLPSSGDMVFYIGLAGGFTARLRKLAEMSTSSIGVSIDGPYGNTDTTSKLAISDKSLLIAGGSGAGFLLPLLESLLQVRKTQAAVHVILVVRHLDSVAWFINAAESILGAEIDDSPNVKVDIHVTLSDQASHSPDPQSEGESGHSDPEKSSGNAKNVGEWNRSDLRYRGERSTGFTKHHS